MADGVRLTSVARTVVDLALRVPFERAVVVADAALHKQIVTSGELRAALVDTSPRHGCGNARRVVAFADRRAESVGESRSRVAMHRAGLPVPVLQWTVCGPDGSIARTDFGWPEHRVIGEFDGLAKYSRLLGPDQTPAQAVVAEKLREDRLRGEGLRVMRWTWRELADFRLVRDRLERALRQR